MREMQVHGLVLAQDSPGSTLILREADGNRYLLLAIGPAEAQSIARGLHGDELSRPLTHDLMCLVVEEMGSAMERVVIHEVKDNTFIGSLDLKTDFGVIELDARPSDAVAMAVRTRVPIFCLDTVLDRQAITQEDIERLREEMNEENE